GTHDLPRRDDEGGRKEPPHLGHSLFEALPRGRSLLARNSQDQDPPATRRVAGDRGAPKVLKVGLDYPQLPGRGLQSSKDKLRDTAPGLQTAGPRHQFPTYGFDDRTL